MFQFFYIKCRWKKRLILVNIFFQFNISYIHSDITIIMLYRRDYGNVLFNRSHGIGLTN